MFNVRKTKILNLFFLKQAILQFFIIALILILNTALGLIFDAEVGSIDVTVFIYSFVLGIVLFGLTLKFGIANGMSRRSYFLGSVIALNLVAIALAFLTTLFVLLSYLTKVNYVMCRSLYHENYGGIFSFVTPVLFSCLFRIFSLHCFYKNVEYYEIYNNGNWYGTWNNLCRN